MKIITRELDEDDKRILKLCSEGMTAKEIGYEINMKPKSVSRRIYVMKKYFDCKSITHLVSKLFEMGKIPYNNAESGQ